MRAVDREYLRIRRAGEALRLEERRRNREIDHSLIARRATRPRKILPVTLTPGDCGLVQVVVHPAPIGARWGGIEGDEEGQDPVGVLGATPGGAEIW